MPLGIISDVHANMEALDATLEELDKRGASEILFLGDAVGYGPDPNDAVMLLKQRCSVLLAGNHDRAALGLADIGHFNPNAKAAILWTAKALGNECREIIKGFEITKRLPDVFLVHSTPKDPELWNYLLTFEDAEENLRCYSERICFVGHSHMPFILERTPSGEMLTYKESVRLKKDCRYIINAGSVGQPRDRDPRACCVLLDEDKIEFLRVRYPVEDTQGKMRKAGLPGPLIERLSHGR